MQAPSSLRRKTVVLIAGQEELTGLLSGEASPRRSPRGLDQAREVLTLLKLAVQKGAHESKE